MGRKYDELRGRLLTALEDAGVRSVRELVSERDALRVERVQLQAENESLRNDLARQPSGIVLDDRDRELLALAATQILTGGFVVGGTYEAAHRLLCRLAEQPVEVDEHARMEDEGGPTAPEETAKTPPGAMGTWVKSATRRDTYGLGSKVKLKEGTKSYGGAVLNVEHEWHVLNIDTRKVGLGYTVFVGVSGVIGSGFWVRPEDIAEVVK